MENQQSQSNGNNIDVLGKKEKNQEDAVMVDLDQSNDKNGGHRTLIEELQRTRSHSSSSSDEELEGGERKRKRKKGLKEKLSGEQEGNVINHEQQDTTTPQNIEEANNNEAPLEKVEATKPEDDKKGFLEKIKEKFNGHHTTENITQAATNEQNIQHLEKKGILEKIKEKLPEHHKNDEDSDIIQKEKHN